jgi:hypothetical protein
MSYRQARKRNWGVAIACLVAVPLLLCWAVVDVVGGSLVCADAAARCDAGIGTDMIVIAVIAALGVTLAAVINATIRAVAKAADWAGSRRG